ncbi:MAG: hypothetical protein JST00_46050 [Deltaproteobacteria bacterium]|nr:hypothetical protein [Deltaproteobacteria bacterium]
MLRAFDGTGTFSDRTPPAGALGYAFGMPFSDAAKRCAAGGFTFRTADDGGFCSGSQTRQRFTAFLKNCGGHVCHVFLIAPVTGDDAAAVSEFRALESELAENYGEPSFREWSAPKQCRTNGALAECLRRKMVKLQAGWTWESKHGILIALDVLPDGRPAVNIAYNSPEGIRRSAEGL